MKIALVVPGGVDPGGERRVVPCLLWLIRRLTKQHDVHVFALFQEGGPPHYRLCGATVHNIGRPRTAIRTAQAVLAEHRRGRFDVLHGIWGSPAGLFAAVAGRVLRCPSVVHLFGGELVSFPELDYGDQRTGRGRRRIRTMFRAATRVTTQSTPMVEAAARHGHRVMRLPFGVDLDEWTPVDPRRRDPDRPAQLVFVASLSPVKDPDLLVATAARLASDGIDFTIDIAGEDLTAGRLSLAAAAAGVADRLRFHGFLEQRRLRQLVLEADALVVTSRHEAGPIVLAEAAVSGVPTAGTPVGAVREWAPEAAVTAAAHDSASMASAIRTLLDDEDRRLEVTRLAKKRAIAEDADWSAATVCRVYGELLAHRRIEG